MSTESITVEVKLDPKLLELIEKCQQEIIRLMEAGRPNAADTLDGSVLQPLLNAGSSGARAAATRTPE
jgi:hypothetical protein